MDITYTTRHGQAISEQIRTRTTRRLERLERFTTRITAADVSFDRERAQRLVEIRLTVARRPPLVARGEGTSFREALDRAVDRLERQLKRWRERRRARRAAGPTAEPGAPPSGDILST